MLVYQQGISNRSLIMTSYKQLVKTIYIPKVHQNYRISWNKCPPSNKHPISNNHPPQISAPSLSLIAGIQGKPVSIATLLITLCVNCIMGLRYRGTTGERNNSPPPPQLSTLLLLSTHPFSRNWKTPRCLLVEIRYQHFLAKLPSIHPSIPSLCKNFDIWCLQRATFFTIPAENLTSSLQSNVSNG